MTGRAVGLLFGAKDKSNPGSSWYCVNFEKSFNLARAFFVKGGLKWNISKNISIENSTTYTFKIVFIKGSVMSFYLNDINIGSYSTEGFEGGYLGCNDMLCKRYF